MSLSGLTIHLLAEMICGAHGTSQGYSWPNFPYRASGKLTAFFRNYCHLPYTHNGETRITWVVNTLNEINADDNLGAPSDKLATVIHELLESVRVELPDKHQGAIDDVNKALNRDGLQIRFINGQYSFFKMGEASRIVLSAERDMTEPKRQTNTKIRSILFLAADPTNESRLRLGEEFREIDEQLKLAKKREQFTLALPHLSLRPRDITGALLNVGPEIVHFSGHGTSKGALCFENQMGQTQLVEPDALAALFEQFAHQVDCVLLNACYSEVQAKAIAKHINYVIGMNQAIGDKAAIAFALGFYQALGAGRTIEDAYKLGCVQIRLQGISEHLTPTLITKQQTKLEGQKPLQATASTVRAHDEPVAFELVQPFKTEFVPIPLFPGVGNSYLRDNYLDLPLGDVVLEGVKFRLEPKSLIFDTNAQIRYYLPRPDGSKEIELQLREPVDHVKSAFFLINSGNSKRIYASEKIGEIILLFKGAPPLITELILGTNIREWCLGNPGDWVRETSGSASRVVWRGMSKDGANAVIDCLRIPVYESMRNCALEKIVFVHKPTQRPSDTLGVHFFVSAISLEIEQTST